jgi:pyruvate formate lyase activating enzyme
MRKMVEGGFYHRLRSKEDVDGAPVECDLCPNRCHIVPGRFGFCKVRFNSAGRLLLPFYGKISAAGIDPVEKKPLYHFLPGTLTYSVGFWGCTLSCPFCQNHHISKTFFTEDAERGIFTSPEKLVKEALESGAPSLSFTYSEPSLHIEYVTEAALLAKKAGLYTVLVTNGYLQEEAAAAILESIDAVNVDLKAFGDDFYKQELHGALEPVKRFIEQAVEMDIAAEITTLLIPGKNNRDEEISAAARYIASLDTDIPWHISAYYPAYKYRLKAATAHEVERAVKVGRKYLNFVYAGNTGSDNDTLCPDCKKVAVKRNRYGTELFLDSMGSCLACGRRIVSKL